MGADTKLARLGDRRGGFLGSFHRGRVDGFDLAEGGDSSASDFGLADALFGEV